MILKVAGRGGVPVTGASAVVLNVTVTQATRAGWMQVYPTGQSAVGSSSNLNVEYTGQSIANMVTVPVGDNGTVTLYSSGGGHLLADAFGYYTPASSVASGRFEALTPVRVLDTREGLGNHPMSPDDSMNCGDFTSWTAANDWFWYYHLYFGDIAQLDGDNDGIPCESLAGAPSTMQIPPRPKAASGSTTYFEVAGKGGVPQVGASAVVLNVTATQASGAGWVQVMPFTYSAAAGAYSNINLTRVGQTAAGLVTVPLSETGTVKIYTSTATHLIADIAGYYTGASDETSSRGLFVPIVPTRIRDTRSGVKPSSGSTVSLAPAGKGGIPSTGAAAIAMNLTATQASGVGYLQVYPTGEGTPGSSSSVNTERAGQTIANAAMAKLGTDGTASVYISRSTHVLGDVAGYFTDDSGAIDPRLNGLNIAPHNTTVAYNRDSWNHWIDADGDCQNTRHEVLINQSRSEPVLTADGCAVISGFWVDPYILENWTQAADVQIDHLVALANAHRSGGWAWTAQQKEDFANDLLGPELVAVEGSVNQAKADSGPETWKPPLTSTWCSYATNWTTVKRKYALTVTQAEYDALAQMLATC
ncbi:GmrSD restriction endonuclease domain-containing protein [Knoellia sp. CPCC 206435]|uniref:GmrSD restriction endonuclease domain-containing protein n=1 Tax=Knoellia terrae TaxID=3404797 RepID=UPI003B43ACA7